MATMTYSNPGWANAGPPALNKTSLDLISNALASIGAGGAASVRDSDSLATVTPGAGGLIALAKAGTIWAADNDGPGSGLDADTVSGCGIGTTAASLGANYDLDTLKKGGIYHGTDIRGTDYATIGSGTCVIEVDCASPTTGCQRLYHLNNEIAYIRWWYSTTVFGNWRKVWDAYSDGNGGQPPAPKPSASAGAGNFVVIATASGVKYTLPANGQWCYFALAFVVAGGAFSTYNFGAHEAGGTDVCAAVAGAAHYGFAWRIEA